MMKSLNTLFIVHSPTRIQDYEISKMFFDKMQLIDSWNLSFQRGKYHKSAKCNKKYINSLTKDKKTTKKHFCYEKCECLKG